MKKKWNRDASGRQETPANLHHVKSGPLHVVAQHWQICDLLDSNALHTTVPVEGAFCYETFSHPPFFWTNIFPVSKSACRSVAQVFWPQWHWANLRTLNLRSRPCRSFLELLCAVSKCTLCIFLRSVKKMPPGMDQNQKRSEKNLSKHSGGKKRGLGYGS